MTFSINSTVLDELLSLVNLAVPSRTPMPAYEYFQIIFDEGKMTVSAGDGEIFLTSSVNITSALSTTILIPASILVPVIKSFGDTLLECTIADNHQINIVTEAGGEYTIPYLEGSEYPVMPDPTDGTNLSFEADTLRNALDNTSFAAGKDMKVRPALLGIHFDFTTEGLVFVATDGHKFSKFKDSSIPTETPTKITVPTKTVQILEKTVKGDDVAVNYSPTAISFSFGQTKLISKLVNDRFPDYNNVIPNDAPFKLKVSKSALISTLKRIMLFTSDNYKYIKLSIKNDYVDVTAENPESSTRGAERVKSTFDGEVPMEIGFNPAFLLEILTHISTDTACFRLISPTKACVIVNDTEDKSDEKKSNAKKADDLLMMLMPTRLNPAGV